MGVEDRIKQLFPSLFITLLSVLIGQVFADLVSEPRGRMTPSAPLPVRERVSVSAANDG